MSKTGWIKVWRKLSESPLWLGEPFTKGQAWIDLLFLAQGTENHGFSRKKNKMIQYEPGFVYHSTLELAARWKWSRGKVRRFLIFLENESMVRIESSTTDGTTLSIVNWAIYQSKRPTNSTTSGTTKRPTDGTTDGHNKEDIIRRYKEEKKGAAAPVPLSGLQKEMTKEEYEEWRRQ